MCENTIGYLLRQQYGKFGDEKPCYLIEDVTEEKEPDMDEHILCRQCCRMITSPAERIEVQNTRQHKFANPNGIVYKIGCFRSAERCGYAGQPSYEFS